MCGIYGAIGCELDEDRGLAALRTLGHRGPDGEGHHHDPVRDVFLGHTRLSIIDLSDSAAQPITNEDLIALKDLWQPRDCDHQERCPRYVLRRRSQRQQQRV